MLPHAKRQSIRPAASRLAVALMAVGFALPAAAQAPPHSEWITLGTGGGPVPSPTQAQPANLLHYADQFILVDVGDGTLEQLVKAKIGLGAVRTVFISHMHFDHTSGLFAVLGNRYQVGAPPITVYGPTGTKKLVDGLVAAIGSGIERLLRHEDASATFLPCGRVLAITRQTSRECGVLRRPQSR